MTSLVASRWNMENSGWRFFMPFAQHATCCTFERWGMLTKTRNLAVAIFASVLAAPGVFSYVFSAKGDDREHTPKAAAVALAPMGAGSARTGA